MSNGLRFAGHPLHPALAHIPIGLLLISPLWEILGLWQGEPLWWGIAFWTMMAGVAAGAIVAVAGFVDYVALPRDHPAERTVIRHLAAVGVGLMLFVVALLLHGSPTPPDGGKSLWVVAVSVAGVMALGLGGWYGGELVYRYGLGREEEGA
jgi:uncharacterized membrane protein